MIAEILPIAAAVLTVLGALFGLLAAIGIVRFPDLLTRLHAVSLAGGIGGGFSFLAVMLTAHSPGLALRALLGLAFLLLTTPVSAHLLARISHRNSSARAVERPVDDVPAQR